MGEFILISIIMALMLWILAVVIPLAAGSHAVAEDIPGALAQAALGHGQGVDKKGQIWAVLVAGSLNFFDYRHQADVCHAYQIFRAHGVPDSNIIVMMYDDIAYSDENPNPGVIINQPGGPNVYQNVPKDYTGSAVTPQNFLNIITGNGTALEGLGSGKVLKSGPNDHVFINLVDRGSTGYFAFPNDILAADDLINTFQKMHQKKMYKKLLVYLEMSYSGSMFDGLLPSNFNILAVSASKPDQGSYACYWNDTLEVYLGDLFSVSWMEDIDSEEHHKKLTTETLRQQYNNVVNRTLMQSTPTMYGTKSIAKDHVTAFFGKDKKKLKQTTADRIHSGQFKEVVKSQDVILHTLMKKIQKRENPEERQKLQTKLDALLKGRREIESLFDRIISQLPNLNVKSIYESRAPLSPEVLPCYKTLVDAFSRGCVNITKNTFVFRHLYKFLNICATEVVSTDQVLEAFKVECASSSGFDGVH